MLPVPCLYFVTEPPKHFECANAALVGGAKVVQLRDKLASDARLLPVAKKIIILCKKHNAVFIVNDRPGLAKRAGAHGVHVGQIDLLHKSVSWIRAQVAPHAIVGVSVHNAVQALRAFEEGADYVGAGPVFQTKSKDDAAKPIGIVGLKKIVLALKNRNARIPIIAIGGLNEKNAESIMRAGASGIAVISAISRAKSPKNAAKRLAAMILRVEKR